MAAAAAAAVSRRREQAEREAERDAAAVPAPALSGQSYWLDLWLFVLFDLALFVLIYLMP